MPIRRLRDRHREGLNFFTWCLKRMKQGFYVFYVLGKVQGSTLIEISTIFIMHLKFNPKFYCFFLIKESSLIYIFETIPFNRVFILSYLVIQNDVNVKISIEQ